MGCQFTYENKAALIVQINNADDFGARRAVELYGESYNSK